MYLNCATFGGQEPERPAAKTPSRSCNESQPIREINISKRSKIYYFFLRNRAGPEKSGLDGSGWVQGTIEAASRQNSPACKPDLGISSPIVYGHFHRYFLYLFHQFAQLPAGREIEREGGSRKAESQYDLQHLTDLISLLCSYSKLRTLYL